MLTASSCMRVWVSKARSVPSDEHVTTSYPATAPPASSSTGRAHAARTGAVWKAATLSEVRTWAAPVGSSGSGSEG